MRDPKRIDVFCKNLAELWHKVPDWRFGQLMINYLGYYFEETKRDPWFVEDDDMMSRMQIWIRDEIKPTFGVRPNKDD